MNNFLVFSVQKKKKFIKVFFGMFLLLLFLISDNIHCEVLKHIVAYNFTNDDIPSIAAHFDLIDTKSWKSSEVAQIKDLNSNSNIKAIFYENAMTHTEGAEENWYMHDELLGLRLINNDWGWYMMDVGNSAYRQSLANRIQQDLVTYAIFDGVFLDDVWGKIADYESSFHVNIVDEEHQVDQNGKILVDFRIWNGGQITVKKIPDDGKNYYTGGNFNEKIITLGSPLPSGTPVNVSYSASDPENIRFPQEKIDSWRSNMVGLLNVIKSSVGQKLLIINTNDVYTDFLAVVDGMMDESFAHANWESASTYRSTQSWKRHLDHLVAAVQQEKIYLAQSGVKSNATEGEIKKINKYCFASYLLGIGSQNNTAMFYFSIGYSGVSYYPEWDVPIGEPIETYHPITDSPLYMREFTNGLVIVNPSNESSSFQLDKQYKTLDNEVVNNIDVDKREGVILLKIQSPLSPPRWSTTPYTINYD